MDSRAARGLSRETLRWYHSILISFAKNYPQLPLDPEPIETFVASCTAGDERRHGYYRALRAFYRFCHKRLRLPNPVEYLDAPRRAKKHPRPLTPDQLDQLLAYPHAPRVKAMLLFLIDTGARVGELVSLTKESLIETPWGYVADISRGKTGARLVPMMPETYRFLLPVLPFRIGTWRIRRLVALAFKDAHVPGSGINLRHSFGTYFEGQELILQQIMGHSHLSTTKGYRALRMKYICEEHHKYSPLRMLQSRTRELL